MRERALCDRHSKLFEDAEPPGARSFFSEIIASISDVQFGGGCARRPWAPACCFLSDIGSVVTSRRGRFVLARDYLTLKLWDVNMEARPLAVFKARLQE